MLCHNITEENGILHFAGYNTAVLAEKYGTPVYLMDEERIRENCRTFTSAFNRYFHTPVKALYASKACCIKALYPIIEEEGLGIDVVSCGEIHTACSAGYPLQEAFFHSNNKTDADIAYAMEHEIGTFVVDSKEETDAIEAQAQKLGKIQNILLRITPDIDPHTYEEVNTGMVDSKFGTAIETGQADQLVQYVLSLSHIQLLGFHCHVGSQVFDEDVLEKATQVMLGFISHIRKKLQFEASVLDIGGGFGVRYTESDPIVDLDARIHSIADVFYSTCEKQQIPCPKLYMEPGRSIVADAGMTLYTVGSIKQIPGYRNYVSVDGGMSDNPRYALYRSAYTCLPAGKMKEGRNMKAHLVGRCCESGDIIQPDVLLPSSMQRGDVVAVCTTGAYNYSMALHYNMLPTPPVVLLSKSGDRPIVAKESFDDLIRNQL